MIYEKWFVLKGGVGDQAVTCNLVARYSEGF
jgi:hypothetical protein